MQHEERHLESILTLEHVGERGRSQYAWRRPRSPPTDAQLAHCGFPGACWSTGISRDLPNLLLLLHGLGDNPVAFARFAAQLQLPQTSALALPAPLPLPLGIPGTMWCESFSADGSLIARSSPKADRRRLEDSISSVTRVRLRRLLALLVRHGGWRLERIFIFGFAQGGSAALDLLEHIDSLDENSGGCTGAEAGRLGGVVSWCGFPVTEGSPLADRRVLGSRTPLLVVCGETDEQTAPETARRLFEDMLARWQPRHLSPSSHALDESPAPPKPSETEQTLKELPGRGQGMVSSASEARLLMEFFARNLSLSSALEDDPNVVRMS